MEHETTGDQAAVVSRAVHTNEKTVDVHTVHAVTRFQKCVQEPSVRPKPIDSVNCDLRFTCSAFWLILLTIMTIYW